jgi:hypothetical protein
MHMKMCFVFFDLVMLPLWFVLSSFCMFPHCDLSSHNLCNAYEYSLYYFVFLLVLPLWYFMVLIVHTLLHITLSPPYVVVMLIASSM